MRVPPGCKEMASKAMRINKSLYGLRQVSRQFRKLLISKLNRIGFVTCFSDTCVIRLVVEHEYAGLIVIHVDDFSFDAKDEMGRVIANALNDHIPAKNLGELSWYMGNEFNIDRVVGTKKISQMSYIRSVLRKYNVSRKNLIPISPRVDARPVMNRVKLGMYRSGKWLASSCGSPTRQGLWRGIQVNLRSCAGL